MVVTSVITKILPIAAVGLGLAFLYNVLSKPGQASESATALSQTFGAFGGGLSSIGGGIQDALTGIGAGSAKLFDPLFTLKTLFYGDDSPEAILQENAATASNTTRTDPVVNTASDQPGVTPTSPAGSTVTHSSNATTPGGLSPGGFTQTTTSTAPSSSSYTSRASGRATRFG